MSAAPGEQVETFRTADGVSLRLTRTLTGRRRVVLVAPGIFLHRESAEHRALARRLAAVADVATMDIRGHGDSEGAFSWGEREPDDVAAVAASLRAHYDRVGGLGFSFGGHHVGTAAARHRAFDAVALVAAPRHLRLDHNPFTPALAQNLPLMLRRRRRPTRLGVPRQLPEGLTSLVHRIAPVPLLIAHGTADWLVPPEHARALFERAGEPKSLLMLEGALHAEYILVQDPEPLVMELLAFFDSRL
ncbi:MAG: hypothetical protein DMF78_00390 [Acidobacteria bacterium]|nr:MAG: hypothetical protein DMF78_00390 [Acidobacteriota bacterium]